MNKLVINFPRPPWARLRRRRCGGVWAFLVVVLAGAPVFALAEDVVRIAYLGQVVERPAALSNLQWLEPPEDDGVQGARLAIDDTTTTGRFTKQRFDLTETMLEADGDVLAALDALIADDIRFVVADLPAASLDAVLAAEGASNLLIFNARATDDRFRTTACPPHLLHTAPSRAMLADALAQYLVTKRWTTWVMVVGTAPEDALMAAALRRAADRFGARVAEEKGWTYGHDARRTAEAEVPVFTQVRDHDVLVVVDEVGTFGDAFPYRTWEPRPVVGTHGLVPVAWDRTIEQWGAAQLQSRFLKKSGRWMTGRDYAVWAAVRSVGEGATQAKSTDFAAIRDRVVGDGFQLAAFKGRKLSYRPWNGQLRQPIPLTTERALVSLSPQEGFLHPASELDTLGYDKPETSCPGR